jgi:hypothetical protein
MRILIDSLNGRNSWEFALVQSFSDNTSIIDLDLSSLAVRDPRQSVFHPVSIISILSLLNKVLMFYGEIISGVSTSGFLSVFSRVDGLNGIF